MVGLEASDRRAGARRGAALGKGAIHLSFNYGINFSCFNLLASAPGKDPCPEKWGELARAEGRGDICIEERV